MSGSRQLGLGIDSRRARRPRTVDVVSHPCDAGRFTIAVRWLGSEAWEYRGNFAGRGEAWAAVKRGDHLKGVLQLLDGGQLVLGVCGKGGVRPAANLVRLGDALETVVAGHLR